MLREKKKTGRGNKPGTGNAKGEKKTGRGNKPWTGKLT